MTRRVLFAFGLFAPVVYLAAVVTGAALTPNYSHIANAISELIAAGAPKKALLDPLFLVYNLLLVGFSVGFFGMANNQANKHLRTSSYFLFVTGFLSVLMTIFFPMDQRGMPATIPGILHMVLAGVISLCTMLTLAFAGLGMKGTQWALHGRFTWVALATIFCTGILAATSAATQSPFMGLFERCTIFTFELWVFVMAGKVYSMAVNDHTKTM